MEWEGLEDFGHVLDIDGQSFELVVGVANAYLCLYWIEAYRMHASVGDPNH